MAGLAIVGVSVGAALADAELTARDVNVIRVDGDTIAAMRAAARRIDSGASAVVLSASDESGGVALTLASAAAGAYALVGAPVDDSSHAAYVDVGYLDAPTEARGLAAAALLPSQVGAGPAVGGLEGRTGPVAEIQAIARAARALRDRYLPAASGWTGPAEPAAWEAAGLYVPTDQRPWFTTPGHRRGALVALASGTLQLVEADWLPAARPAFDPSDDLHLLLIRGGDAAELVDGAARAETALGAGTDPTALCRAAWDAPPVGGLMLALLGRNTAELSREIAAARGGLAAALGSAGEWQTPRGSYCTAEPLGSAGAAFVYPGAFSSYLGMARESLRLFPRGHEWLAELSTDVGARFAQRRLYPRSVARPGVQELSRWEAELADDAVGLIESGLMLSALHTRALDEVFGVRPTMAFGYSLGEISMLIALGVWRPDEPSNARLEASPLFHTRLSGPKEAVRAFLRLPPGALADWATHVVLAPPAEVEAALDPSDPAYLTIVNGPDEVVIAGEPAACARLIARVGRESLPAPFGNVLHCPPAESEEGEFAAMMGFPTRPVAGIAFYSAAGYRPLALDGPLAEQLAHMSVRRLDFARLVERVYADGARVFVELGPGGTGARLIRAILKGRPHLAVQLVRRGADDQSSLYRALARLASHSVPVDLGPLFGEGGARNAGMSAVAREILDR